MRGPQEDSSRLSELSGVHVVSPQDNVGERRVLNPGPNLGEPRLNAFLILSQRCQVNAFGTFDQIWSASGRDRAQGKFPGLVGLNVPSQDVACVKTDRKS